MAAGWAGEHAQRATGQRRWRPSQLLITGLRPRWGGPPRCGGGGAGPRFGGCAFLTGGPREASEMSGPELQNHSSRFDSARNTAAARPKLPAARHRRRVGPTGEMAAAAAGVSGHGRAAWGSQLAARCLRGPRAAAGWGGHLAQIFSTPRCHSGLRAARWAARRSQPSETAASRRCSRGQGDPPRCGAARRGAPFASATAADSRTGRLAEGHARPLQPPRPPPPPSPSRDPSGAAAELVPSS